MQTYSNKSSHLIIKQQKFHGKIHKDMHSSLTWQPRQMKECLISKTINPIYNITVTTHRYTDMQTHMHTHKTKNKAISMEILIKWIKHLKPLEMLV